MKEQAGKYETVEALTRYAAAEFERVGVRFPPARMSKLIRREMRAAGPEHVRRVIDRYLDRKQAAATWTGFQLYAAGGYKDPTGAHAAHNIDRARAA